MWQNVWLEGAWFGDSEIKGKVHLFTAMKWVHDHGLQSQIAPSNSLLAESNRDLAMYTKKLQFVRSQICPPRPQPLPYQPFPFFKCAHALCFPYVHCVLWDKLATPLCCSFVSSWMGDWVKNWSAECYTYTKSCAQKLTLTLPGQKSIILQSHRQWLVTLYPDVDLELRIGLLTPSSKQTYYSSTLCFHKQSEQFLLLLGERTELLIMQLFTHLQQLVI